MTTEDALLAAVLAAPDDDLPRLVLADHYEGELGQPERAEFIRVQVEMAKVPVKTFGPDEGKEELRHTNLKRRERELWDAGVYAKYREDVPTTVHVLLPGWTSCSPIEAHPRRGFVSEVRCTLVEWCGAVLSHQLHCRDYLCSSSYRMGGCECSCGDCMVAGQQSTGIGPQIVRRHPVTRVLTDREPHENPAGVFVFNRVDGEPEHSSEVPAFIFDLMEGGSAERPTSRTHTVKFYSTRELADKALSAALIAWAKAENERQKRRSDDKAGFDRIRAAQARLASTLS